MSDKLLQPWKEHDVISARRLNGMCRLLEKHDKFLNGTGGSSIDTGIGRVDRTQAATRIEMVRMTEWLEPDHPANRDAAVQYYNPTSGEFADSGQNVDNVTDPTGLMVIPQDSILPVVVHWSGQRFPIWQNHAFAGKATTPIDAMDEPSATRGSGTLKIWDWYSGGYFVETIYELTVYNLSAQEVDDDVMLQVKWNGKIWIIDFQSCST